MSAPVDDASAQERTLQVEPDAGAVRAARHDLDRWLRERGRDDADVAALLVSELLTNVVLHARTSAQVRVTLEDDCLRVVVSDGAPTLPTRRRPTTDAVTGRGLMIVDAMSDDWGVEAFDGGKSVWFELTGSRR
jgi:anti-sigma regulatory factor (Ser/Thr protein kinase)